MGIAEMGTIVAIAVGVYGAILSTFLFIREGRKARRNIRVICEETVEKWPEDKPARILPTYAAITIRAINTSYRPVVVVAVGFYLSNGKKIEKYGEEAGLPIKIEDGESLGVPFGIASLENRVLAESYATRPKPTVSKRVGSFIHDVYKKHIPLRFRSPIYTDYIAVDDSDQASNGK